MLDTLSHNVFASGNGYNYRHTVVPGGPLMHHNRATDRLEHILSAIAPASGGLVMGTEIVSIALSLDHRETLSRMLLAIAAAAWIALGLLLAGRALHDRERVHQEAGSPAA
jgi:hypothetical protein